jgi:hypothetical protein
LLQLTTRPAEELSGPFALAPATVLGFKGMDAGRRPRASELYFDVRFYTPTNAMMTGAAGTIRIAPPSGPLLTNESRVMSWSVGVPVRTGENSVSLAIENASSLPENCRCLSVVAYEHDGSPRMLVPSLAPFLPIVVSLAAIKSEDVSFKAVFDDGYFAGLSCGLAPFASAFFGGRTPVLERITDCAPASAPTHPGASALLFSAGVDSFYSLKLLLDQGTPQIICSTSMRERTRQPRSANSG